MIDQKRDCLHHASSTTTGAKAMTIATEPTGPPKLDGHGAALAAHAWKTILKSITRQVIFKRSILLSQFL